MPIEKVAVIGAGTMGSGIAQVCAQVGWETRLFDAFPEGSYYSSLWSNVGSPRPSPSLKSIRIQSFSNDSSVIIQKIQGPKVIQVFLFSSPRPERQIIDQS